MNKYDVFIEFFGKKLKTTVIAKNEEQAKNEIIDKVNFVEVRKVNDLGEKIKQAESLKSILDLFIEIGKNLKQ